MMSISSFVFDSMMSTLSAETYIVYVSSISTFVEHDIIVVLDAACCCRSSRSRRIAGFGLAFLPGTCFAAGVKKAYFAVCGHGADCDPVCGSGDFVCEVIVLFRRASFRAVPMEKVDFLCPPLGLVPTVDRVLSQ